MRRHASDVNGNAVVDANDLNQLASVLLGGSCVPACMAAADVNGDGVIDGMDIPIFVRFLLGW